MYHRINSVADEKRLLEQKLALQSTIREKRERQRRKRTHDTEVYSQMLEPVTKSIAKLTTPITVDPSTSAVAPKQEPIKKEEEEDESEPSNQPEEEEQSEPTIIKEEEPGDLYQEALAMVPRKLRDDGQLGLCPSTHHIGIYAYAVHGNILQVVTNENEENEEMHQFEITDLNLWKLLLVLNPSKIGLKLTTQGENKKKEYLPFVLDYVHIAHKLNLLDSYTGSKNRVKYTLIAQVHGGSGFLFTSIPPSPPTPPPTPRVIVLPPDNRGLMSELYKAVAELHAGNTTMRNVIVPMVQEARRRHIRIPPELLENLEDYTWVLA